MKKSIIFLLLILSTTAYSQTAADFSKLGWLEGSWRRTNAKSGRSGVENWKKISATEMMGRGVNMKGADTTFIEKIRLVVKDGSIYYVADVPENKGDVYFKCTDMSDTHFVCENPAHDFPKKIVYRKRRERAQGDNIR